MCNEITTNWLTIRIGIGYLTSGEINMSLNLALRQY